MSIKTALILPPTFTVATAGQKRAGYRPPISLSEITSTGDANAVMFVVVSETPIRAWPSKNTVNKCWT